MILGSRAIANSLMEALRLQSNIKFKEEFGYVSFPAGKITSLSKQPAKCLLEHMLYIPL